MARADTLPGPLEYTAKKNGLYAVQDSTGAIISEHITEREALQNAANYAITKKTGYTVIHNYTVAIVYKFDQRFLVFEWLPPVAREDGTMLEKNEISGYIIYGGSSPDNLSKMFEIKIANTFVGAVPDSVVYFAVSSVDENGLESGMSKTVEVIAE